MLIYSYSKSINTEELLLETKIVLKYKKVVKKKKKVCIMLYVLFRTGCFPNHGNSYCNCTLE